MQAGEVAALARVEARLGRSLTAAFENRTAEALAAQKRTSAAVRQATGATAKREVATARVPQALGSKSVFSTSEMHALLRY